eukprot:1156079-Pleurochrysis_carterae.AAC.1
MRSSSLTHLHSRLSRHTPRVCRGCCSAVSSYIFASPATLCSFLPTSELLHLASTIAKHYGGQLQACSFSLLLHAFSPLDSMLRAPSRRLTTPILPWASFLASFFPHFSLSPHHCYPFLILRRLCPLPSFSSSPPSSPTPSPLTLHHLTAPYITLTARLGRGQGVSRAHTLFRRPSPPLTICSSSPRLPLGRHHRRARLGRQPAARQDGRRSAGH